MTSPPPPPENQNTNTLGPINETPISSYYKAEGTMDSEISDKLALQGALDINTIRCPEGYVFEGSHVLSSYGENLSVLKYSTVTNPANTQKWLYNNEDIVDTELNSDTITCVKKYCLPQGIVNSDKEFDVLIDGIATCTGNRTSTGSDCAQIAGFNGDPSGCPTDDGCIFNPLQTITCNDGYVFDRIDRSGIWQYNVYIPVLKWMSKITTCTKLNNYDTARFRLHLFKDEDSVKRKLRLSVFTE